MSETINAIYAYVEDEPKAALATLGLPTEELDIAADSLSESRAQLVADKAAAVLLTKLTARKLVREERLLEVWEEEEELTSELSSIEAEISNLTRNWEGVRPPASVSISEVIDRYNTRARLTNEELVESLSTYDAFTLNIGDDNGQRTYESGWVNARRDLLNKTMGSRVSAFTRACVAVNRNVEVLERNLGESVTIQKTASGTIEEIMVQNPQFFIEEALKCSGFGLKSACSLLAMAELQQLPVFANYRG